jgi:hypothetical protein
MLLMKNSLRHLGTVMVMFSLPAASQVVTPVQQQGWIVGANVLEESVGQGLPVLALDRPDWPKNRTDQPPFTRAWRSVSAELMATHATGWRIAALARAEAWLHANADAVDLAALNASGSDPAVARNYNLYAQMQSWQGDGVKVGTPWWPLDAEGRWQWQADAQLMQLRQLREAELAGNLRYLGAGVYDFDARSQRSNTGITSPFLPSSGTSGLGSSLSVALTGQPVPGWRVELRADDLFSRLQWSNLATDANTLNSQVTSRAPDGSLDYGPLLKGQKSLMEVTDKMSVNWHARLAWSAFESSESSDALTIRTSRKAALNQTWLGWDSGPAPFEKVHWRLEVEPVFHAVQLGLDWRGWQVLLASDGQGMNSQYRRVQAGWQANF